MMTKKKLYSSLIFVLFLIGSTIIYYELGRLAAIGIALQVFAIYILIKFDLSSIAPKKDNNTSEN